MYEVAFFLLLLIGLYALFFFGKRTKPMNKVRSENFVDRTLLEEHVLFYKKLGEEDRRAFEADIQYFLSHTRITGVDIEVEPLDELLIASAACIPIFYFGKWRYHNLREVLLYADAINHQYESKGNNDRNILGMVGDGVYNNVMLISKHALRLGFSNKTDKHNTAIHEFMHLIDKADGAVDGVPELLLEQEYVLPWIELMYEKTQEIIKRKSDINEYAYTNRAEFFAVVSEYFFERPGLLQNKHPKLYKMMVEIFDTKESEK